MARNQEQAAMFSFVHDLCIFKFICKINNIWALALFVVKPLSKYLTLFLFSKCLPLAFTFDLQTNLAIFFALLLSYIIRYIMFAYPYAFLVVIIRFIRVKQRCLYLRLFLQRLFCIALISHIVMLCCLCCLCYY